MTLDLERVYLLSSAHARGALHARPRQRLEALPLLRGDVVPAAPLVFDRAAGHYPQDLVGTEYAMLYLVSERVVEALSNHGLTGWTTYRVQLYGESGEHLQGYYGLAITGPCGPLDPTRSERVILAPPPGGRAVPGWRGWYFEPGSWDGSDFFVPEGTGYILVTERVKELLELELKASNVRFSRITEMERQFA